MATSINVRLSDDLEEKLKKTVELLKKETPLGAEVNNSTIVRGALEEFINKIDDKEKGVYNYYLELGDLSNEQLKEIRDYIYKFEKLIKPEDFGVESSNDIPKHIKILNLMLLRISLDTLTLEKI